MPDCIALDFSRFEAAATATYRLQSHVPTERDDIVYCGGQLSKIPTTVDDFEKFVDPETRKRLATAAAIVKPRYRQTINLIGFVREIGGKATKANKASADDLSRMNTFFVALAQRA